MSRNIILGHDEIAHKIVRIAYQIYETFPEERSIVIAGIASNGFVLAQKIAEQLQRISTIDVLLVQVNVDKTDPLRPITTSHAESHYANRGLVLVDDVLNSGATLIYGVRHFLAVPIKKFKTAVLVDRNHKQFPVKADFKGISMSTSLREHVEVVFSSDGDYAELR